MSRQPAVWLVASDPELEHQLDDAGFVCVTGAWPGAAPSLTAGLRAVAERPGRFDAVAFESAWAVVACRELAREAGTLGDFRRLPALAATTAAKLALQALGWPEAGPLAAGASVAAVVRTPSDAAFGALLDDADVTWVSHGEPPDGSALDAACVASAFAAAVVASVSAPPALVLALGPQALQAAEALGLRGVNGVATSVDVLAALERSLRPG